MARNNKRVQYRKENSMQSSIKKDRKSVIDETYRSFFELINDNASLNDLKKNEKDLLIQALREVYISKKAELVLNERLSKFNEFLNFSVDFALKQSSDTNTRNNYNVAYVRHLKELITNE
jgi:hypothetical protein